MIIVDAHSHLWKKQQGMVNGKEVYSIGGGKSNFGGEIRQMQPPYMLDGANLIDMLISNMDYAQVSGAVITQEYIDGNQDNYLLECKDKYSGRLKICSLYEENSSYVLDGFDGIKICAGRLKDSDLTKHIEVFEDAQRNNKFISIDLADGDIQVSSMKEIIQSYPNLKIAIGHFGMVTRQNWERQIELARNQNVFIESGGITWLFNDEFYPYKGAINAIKTAVEICGTDKLMWGSDYPRTMTEITYKMSYDFITKSDSLTSEQKELFLGKNAIKFYEFDNLMEIEQTKNML